MRKIVIEKIEIQKKKILHQKYFSLTLGPFSKAGAVRPGQFVHIGAPGTNIFFRRAFSVYDTSSSDRTFDILFKVFGRGTAVLSQKKQGDLLDVMGPLGNGFSMPSRRETVIMAAGGIGMPPIYLLAKEMVNKGFDTQKILLFYGGNSKDDLIDLSRIRRLGVKLVPATDDGSFGFHGFVSEAIEEKVVAGNGHYRLYGCGPVGMLKAVDRLAVQYGIPGQLSLEAPMPCGIGVCLGCILPLTSGGYTRVCREGPVYNVGEVIL